MHGPTGIFWANLTAFSLKAKAAGAVVLEGELKIGGQSHFAMEKNVCLSIPTQDGRYELHHSTQMPDAARGFVAMAMGISEEKITIIVRRMGGGFGGKVKLR
jgi:xanthine dehydrogenase large subunit